MTEWQGIPHDITPYVGFVYVIRNTLNKRYYIGQKKFLFIAKLRPLKGHRNARHRIKESDWKTYWGSSKELLEDIEQLGKDSFARNIVFLCKSKAEMNYREARLQFQHDVLHDPLSYNGIINCRIGKSQITFSL